MDTSKIIDTLKTTPYKYTFASKVRDYLKKDVEGDADEIIDQLRIKISDPGNSEIARPIKEILKHFRRNVV